ncbi:hypothetical protein GYH30_056247 [Glycine max]|nr:hypothetical protein GYH30_056247 [Glycine max]
MIPLYCFNNSGVWGGHSYRGGFVVAQAELQRWQWHKRSCKGGFAMTWWWLDCGRGGRNGEGEGGFEVKCRERGEGLGVRQRGRGRRVGGIGEGEKEKRKVCTEG